MIYWPEGIGPPAASRDSQSSVNSVHLPPVYTLRDTIDPTTVLLSVGTFPLCIIIYYLLFIIIIIIIYYVIS